MLKIQIVLISHLRGKHSEWLKKDLLLKWYIYVNYTSTKLKFLKWHISAPSRAPLLFLWRITFHPVKATMLDEHQPPTSHTLGLKEIHLASSRKSSQVAVTPEKIGLGSRPKLNVPRIFIPRCRWYSGRNAPQKYRKPFHCREPQECLLCFILKL